MGMGVLFALFLDPIVILATLWVLFRGATLKGLILIVWLASGFKGILLLSNDSLSSNEWGFLLIASAISTLIMCLFAQWIRKLFFRKSVNRSVSADEPSVARDDIVHDALNEEFIASNWGEQIIEVFETYTSGQKANSLNEEATFSKQKWVLGYLGTLLTAVTKETDGDRNYKIGLFTFQFVYGAHLGQQLFHRYLNLLKVEDSTIISGGRAAQKDAFEWEKKLENLPQTVSLGDLDLSDFSFVRLIKYLKK